MGRAATPATSCRNCLRGGFILNLSLSLSLSGLFLQSPRRGGAYGRYVFTPARQAHHKDRAFAVFARYGHIAAHHARELAGDRKAKPRSAVAARRQGIGLGEILEQFRL